MEFKFLIAAVLFSVLYFTDIVTYCSAQDTVMTPVGGFNGVSVRVPINGHFKTVNTFLGIPYAEPPVGSLRFQKPVSKAAALNGTFLDVRTPPPSCYQAASNVKANQSTFDEDCLFLNIYAPEYLPEIATFPVMIWIHGGGFDTGTSSDFDGSMLSAFGDVIVVTINYRLEMFGFLRSSDGSLSGNQGLWDQHLAFQWVNKNIKSFHGNPDDVTIFGQSEGSVAVTLQALYPGNKGLFKRVIAQSGSALRWKSITTKPNLYWIADAAQCSTMPVRTALDCVKHLPAEALNVHQRLRYGAFIDGEFLMEHPYTIVFGNNSISSAARSFFASLDIITGVVSSDGAILIHSTWAHILNESDINDLHLTPERFKSLIVKTLVRNVFSETDNTTQQELISAVSLEYTNSSDPANVDSLNNNLVAISSDTSFFATAVQTARGHAALNGGRTYFYEFAVTPSHHELPTPNWVTGSNHEDDIQFEFGEPVKSPNSYTANEIAASKAMMSLWANFAWSGNPNSHVKDTRVGSYLQSTWPEYTQSAENYLRFTDSSASVQQNFHAQRMALWLRYVPMLLNSSKTQLPTPIDYVDPMIQIIG